jgi:hypothetical protein
MRTYVKNYSDFLKENIAVSRKDISILKVPIILKTAGETYQSIGNPDLIVKCTGAGKKENQFSGIVVKDVKDSETYREGYSSDEWYCNNFKEYLSND